MTHGTRTELACLASVAAAIKRAEAGLARASLILNAAIDEGAAK
jgi:hypothetical protein